MNTDSTVYRVWSFFAILRYDGVCCGNYFGHLIYPALLKLANE